jgi:hypothetical protein
MMLPEWRWVTTSPGARGGGSGSTPVARLAAPPSLLVALLVERHRFGQHGVVAPLIRALTTPRIAKRSRHGLSRPGLAVEVHGMARPAPRSASDVVPRQQELGAHDGRDVPAVRRAKSPLSGSALPRQSLREPLASGPPDAQNARTLASPENKALRLIYETHARAFRRGFQCWGALASASVRDSREGVARSPASAITPSRRLRWRLPAQDGVVAAGRVLTDPLLPMGLGLLLTGLVLIVIEGQSLAFPRPPVGFALQEDQPGSHGRRKYSGVLRGWARPPSAPSDVQLSPVHCRGRFLGQKPFSRRYAAAQKRRLAREKTRMRR